jgi:hypothetical protein
MPSVGEMETSGCKDVKTKAPVVIDCRSNMETICCMRGPRSTCGRVVVNEGFCSEQSKRRFGEIEWSIEFVVG